jgi:uncharacterized membrane protein
MNGAHLHLILNHVSIFSLVIGTVALAVSMKRKSVDLRVLATTLFVLTGVFAWIAFATGENAEEVVKVLGGGTESLIEQHAQAAVWARRSGTLVAILALGTEWAIRNKKKWVKPLQWTLLVFALHGCTVFVATSFLGGQIRHSEVRN